MNRVLTGVLLLLFTVFTVSAQAQVTINEFRIDQGGADNDEYFELCFFALLWPKIGEGFSSFDFF